MKDSLIIDLFWNRKESAIKCVMEKYGQYCRAVVCNILPNTEDMEECLNDTWLKLWNAIPPAKPDSLKAYTAKVARNTAITLYKNKTAAFRGGGAITECIDELQECTALSGNNVAEYFEEAMLREKLNHFLDSQTETNRNIFIRRYFYMQDIKEIAALMQKKESTVKVILHRMRTKLSQELESEGFL